MPSPFDITTVSNTVTLDNNRAGVASFTAKNNTRRRIHATAKLTLNLADDKQPIAAVPPDAPKWLTIAPPPPGSADSATSREFPIDGTQSYQVNILVPLTAAPASYKIRLTLADEVNPDDNFSDSPDVIFTVREIPKPSPRPFPVWIIAAIIIAVLLVIVIAVVAITSNSNVHFHETETAVKQTEEATGNAISTQTALAPYAGSWTPIGTGSSILALSIGGTDTGELVIKYTVPCPLTAPPNVFCRVGATDTREIDHVPFNSSSLGAGDSLVALLISPANNGQLLVSSQIKGTTSVQSFQHGTFFSGTLRQAEANLGLNSNLLNILKAVPTPKP
jgi:hypothetical protein